MGKYYPHVSILREYDIRGIVGETLFEYDAYALGLCFSKELGHQGQVCVGLDGRLSSEMLANALMKGLRTGGMDVLSIGVCPTPMVYFSSHRFGAAGAIMVTGSHNPPNHNGFKILKKGCSFFGKDLQNLFQSFDDLENAIFSEGCMEEVDLEEDYLKDLLKEMTMPSMDFKSIWDCGNGSTGNIVRKLLSRLPGEHRGLYMDVDGAFPNHHPDPAIAENMIHLRQAVLEDGADLGIAFDGDGDRIGVVGPKGRLYFGDELLMLYAWSVLQDYPQGIVIADVKTSQIFFDQVREWGGIPLMWKTGHSLMREKLRLTEGAILAGEMSGHIFFADRHCGYDDAIYAALRLLEILHLFKGSLDDFFTKLPRLESTPEIRIDCCDEQKFLVIENIKASLLRECSEDIVEIFTLDGLRFQFLYGWGLIRASNTQPALVVRCEAKNPEYLLKYESFIVQCLEKNGVSYGEG